MWEFFINLLELITSILQVFLGLVGLAGLILLYWILFGYVSRHLRVNKFVKFLWTVFQTSDTLK